MKKLLLFTFLYANILSITPTLNFNPVSFEASMRKSYAYNSHDACSNEWQILRYLYDKTLIFEREISPEPRIPKIIHWIWLGSPLPDKYKALQNTWKKHNPYWEFKLWTDADVKAFNLKNKSAFDSSINWGEKSDIFRYEILYRYGGVYVDIDFECIRSFDILNHICDFYAGIAYTNKAIFYNGLIGASKQHPIIEACVQNVRSSGSNNSHSIMTCSGPYFFTSMFFQAIALCKNNLKTLPLPVTYLYPLPNNERNNLKWSLNSIQHLLHQESFAVHYWGTSWVKN